MKSCTSQSTLISMMSKASSLKASQVKSMNLKQTVTKRVPRSALVDDRLASELGSGKAGSRTSLFLSPLYTILVIAQLQVSSTILFSQTTWQSRLLLVSTRFKPCPICRTWSSRPMVRIAVVMKSQWLPSYRSFSFLAQGATWAHRTPLILTHWLSLVALLLILVCTISSLPSHKTATIQIMDFNSPIEELWKVWVMILPSQSTPVKLHNSKRLNNLTI